MTRGPQTQGPRASRRSLPPSLYLKTWGRRRAAGRSGGGDGTGQGVRHTYPRSPTLAQAQQPPEAQPKITPR